MVIKKQQDVEDTFDLDKLIKLKTKKKKINSSKKGSNFEREICKIFNDRFKTTNFCKTPGSGAYATTHNLPDHLKIYGDIISPINFKFCIECKNGYDKESIYSLINPSSQIWDFVKKLRIDTNKAGKEGMIVLKQSKQKILCILINNININLHNKIEVSLNKENILICKLEDLLNQPDYFWFE